MIAGVANMQKKWGNCSPPPPAANDTVPNCEIIVMCMPIGPNHCLELDK